MHAQRSTTVFPAAGPVRMTGAVCKASHLPDLLALSSRAFFSSRNCRQRQKTRGGLPSRREIWRSVLSRGQKASRYIRRQNRAEVNEYRVHAKQRRVDIAVVGLEADVSLCSGRLICQRRWSGVDRMRTAMMNSLTKALACDQQETRFAAKLPTGTTVDERWPLNMAGLRGGADQVHSHSLLDFVPSFSSHRSLVPNSTDGVSHCQEAQTSKPTHRVSFRKWGTSSWT